MSAIIKDKVFRTAIDGAVKEVLKYIEKDDFEGTQKKLFEVLDQARALAGNSADAAVFASIRDFISDRDSKWMKFLYSVLRKTSPNVIRTSIMNIAYQSVAAGMSEVKNSIKKYGCAIPWFVIIEPTNINNLKKAGKGRAAPDVRMSYDELNSAVTQCKQLGLYFFIIYGCTDRGEPLTLKDDLLKLAKKHRECAFHTVTNGTLVDDSFAKEAALRGNITFSFEYLGTKSQCDSIYGDGTGRLADNGMIHMRRRGVLFGAAAECSSQNLDYLISDAFYELMISKACRFVTIMHYIPRYTAGTRADSSDELELTAPQKDTLLKKINDIRGDKGGKPVFAVDFFTDVKYIGNQITAPLNYIHIDASGDVARDTFVHTPDAAGNIKKKRIIQILRD